MSVTQHTERPIHHPMIAIGIDDTIGDRLLSLRTLLANPDCESTARSSSRA